MKIEIEKLDNFIIPIDAFRMTIMQPWIDDNLTDSEIYRIVDEDKQITRIKRTLEIAKKDNEFGISHSHFTILPEYSIPGINGVKFIQSYLERAEENWPNNSILIGGVDGLDKNQYTQILIGSKVSSSNSVTEVPDDKWVNCCITWIKTQDIVTRYVQPKIIPAWLEKNTSYRYMYTGKSIYLFEAKDLNGLTFRFANLICADWMDSEENGRSINILLNALQNTLNNDSDPKYLHILFVVKHNTKPNNPLFLKPVQDFFTNSQYSKIDRNNCLLVFANTAAGNLGKKDKYGFTSIIAHPNSSFYSDSFCCPPTFAVITKVLRSNNELLGRCKQALFRENGNCIHSCKIFIPYYMGHKASDRNFIIDEAHVYSMEATESDPRAPDSSVTASVKWVNDEIDNIVVPNTMEGIRTEVENSFKFVIDEIKWSQGDHLQKLINIGTNRTGLNPNEQQERWKNVDVWDSMEIESLKTIIKSLTALACNKNYDIEIKDTHFHATIKTKDSQGDIKDFIDVIIVRSADNSLNHESNLKYLETYIEEVKKNRRVFIISCSDNDHSDLSREKKINEVNQVAYNYTNITNCLGSIDINELKNKIDALLKL